MAPTDDDPLDMAPALGESVSVLHRLEQERTDIAREVHDEIGGALTALHFDLSWLARQPVSPAVQTRLSEAMQTLAEAVAATQSITSRLRPASLVHGLAPALQALAQSLEKRTGVHVTVTSPTPAPTTPADVERVAYRIAQEALTNIGKHAHCRQACVAVSATPQEFRLHIEDDGVGIETAGNPKPGRFGLRGMHERAASVNGALAIHRRPGSGTCVVLTVPMREPGTEPG
jgi:signal transduction histidine kinase